MYVEPVVATIWGFTTQNKHIKKITITKIICVGIMIQIEKHMR